MRPSPDRDKLSIKRLREGLTPSYRRKLMRSRHHCSLRFILLAGAALIGTTPTFAAEHRPAYYL
jgi:hypothetical protein